jgi:hypothetical protein
VSCRICTLLAVVATLGGVVTVGAAGFRLHHGGTTGLTRTNAVPAERHLTNQIYLNGSGVALADWNGDGRTDLFIGGMAGSSRLYRGERKLAFVDATAPALPELPGGLDVTGCLGADLNGDGTPDLVLNTIGQGTWLFTNSPAGVLRQAGPPLNRDRAGMSVAAADVDGDGDLDLYLANYRAVTLRDEPNGKFGIKQDGARPRIVTYNGRSTAEPDLVGRFYLTPTGPKENGQPDVLLLNDGRGGFTPVSWTDGAFLDEAGKPLAAAPYDWGLSVLFRDLNGDGRPDLYVCNDFESPDRFWLNETPPGGPVRFRAISTVALRNTPAFSMGVDAADVNRDGHDDVFVLDMLSRDHRQRNYQVDALPTSHHEPGLWADRPQFSHNTLFLGRANGSFAEAGRLAGLSASEWAWTPVFLDVDLDGWEDVLISNGHELDMMDADASLRAEQAKGRKALGNRELLELRRLFRRFAPPKAAFRNLGNLAFADVSRDWGFATEAVTQGLALGDLDGDGDLDVVANNLNDTPAIYENLADAPRLLVRLKGARGNSAGIGARIVVRGGPVPEQAQVVMAGGRYLGGDEPVRCFAAGAARELSVEVRWPAGTVSRVEHVRPNQTLVVKETSAATVAAKPPPVAAAWFEDVSERLQHVHTESAFDDFARQPLLTRQLGEGGPGVTWADLNGDGGDDLVISSGAGGTLAAFLNDGTGQFRRATNAPLNRPTARDQGAVLFQSGALLTALSNYEDGLTNGGALRLVDLARNVSGEVLTGQAGNYGAMAAADVDGDGELELFLGGRAVAGRYPEAFPSLLVKVVGGRFAVVQRFEKLGVVNGAVFSDFDGDGKPELAVAADWSPVRVFRIEGEKIIELTEPSGLAQTSGWWNSVAAGDFDGDGRMDLLAGNWGWNVFPVPRAPTDGREPAATNRRRLRWGDVDGNGVTDLIESYFDSAGRELPYRKFDAAASALPFLRERFATRADYGAATLAEIYGDALGKLPLREAAWFGTTLFRNRGGRFEARPLPVEAQFAPTFGLAVADFDGDGHDDVFLAQNFYAVSPDEARQDGGRGLLLRGDGRGNLTAVTDSGAHAYGDGRGAAVADFDGDGRSDLAVGQNGSQTKLFRNRSAKPGLRVHLAGTAGNPDAIGAQLRLFAGEAGGPLREVHRGGGHWSVASPTRVLTHVDVPTALEVKWPGGAVKRYPLPAGTKRITAKPDGTAEVQ